MSGVDDADEPAVTNDNDDSGSISTMKAHKTTKSSKSKKSTTTTPPSRRRRPKAATTTTTTTKTDRESKKSSSTTTKKRPAFSSPLVVAHTKQQTNDDDHDGSSEKNDPKTTETTVETNQKKKEWKRARIEKANVKEEEEEKRLTDLLFGGSFGVLDVPVDDDGEEDGGGGGLDSNDEEEEEGGGGGEALFEIDRTGNHNTPSQKNGNHDVSSTSSSPSSDDDQSEPSTTTTQTKTPTPTSSAWIDEDDQNLAISLSKSSNRVQKLRNYLSEDVLDGADYAKRLRARFDVTSSQSARTDWAHVEEDDEDDTKDDDDDDYEAERSGITMKLLSSTTPLLASTTTTNNDTNVGSRRLPPNILGITRKPNANQMHVSQSCVQSVQFYPGGGDDDDGGDAVEEENPLLFTAGLDKTLRFFKIVEGGERSEKVHGIHFPDMPIRCASFLGDSGNVVVSGRRSYFYIYDAAVGKIDKVPRIAGRDEKSLEKFTTSPDGTLIAFYGNDGYIILVEARTKLWVANMKINGSVRAITFTPDGKYILSSGSDGDVYKWDVRTRRCVDKFQNEDGTITSTLSSSSRFLAVGAESGVVNIYDETNASSAFERRTPSKSIMNLQSSVDFMKFNHDGRILAMTTKREKDSMKLLHVPSQTIFSNWPTSKTPLGYVWSMDFSPKSKYMAIGNDKGQCLLYNLTHYNT